VRWSCLFFYLLTKIIIAIVSTPISQSNAAETHPSDISEVEVIPMATPAQTLANQKNSALSTGPRTEAGKEKVSANATRHGLSSKRVVLATEDRAAFDALRDQLVAHYEPADETERTLVDRLAEETWRLQRCRGAETAFLDAAIKEIAGEDDSLTPDQAMARLFTDTSHSPKMQLFLRYQAAIERAFDKVRRELDRHLQARYAAEEQEQIAMARAAAASNNGFVSHVSRVASPSTAVSPAVAALSAVDPESPADEIPVRPHVPVK
jgi:hypothetical protein